MTLTPAAENQMDCYCLDDGKLWPVDERDQEICRGVLRRADD
jgi:hypothetical protein